MGSLISHLTACQTSNTHTASSLTHLPRSDCTQSVAEAYVCGGQEDSQSGSATVHSDSGLTLHQLQVEVEQQQTQELFDLVHSKVSSGTHGGAGAERHAVIPQPLAVLVEVRLLSAVLDVTVEPERLMGNKHSEGQRAPLNTKLDPLYPHVCLTVATTN